jgi:hypothetical protein
LTEVPGIFSLSVIQIFRLSTKQIALWRVAATKPIKHFTTKLYLPWIRHRSAACHPQSIAATRIQLSIIIREFPLSQTLPRCREGGSARPVWHALPNPERIRRSSAAVLPGCSAEMRY